MVRTGNGGGRGEGAIGGFPAAAESPRETGTASNLHLCTFGPASDSHSIARIKEGRKNSRLTAESAN